jgi:hypothetical protein
MKPRCIDSRPTSEGYRKRRYRDDLDVETTTIEVPMTVWKAINKQGRDNDRAAQHMRMVEKRRKIATACKHWHLGWKAIASAHEIGVPVRTVQRWRARFMGTTKFRLAAA